MSSVVVTLPDGSTRSVEVGAPVRDVAALVSPRLAKAAIVARGIAIEEESVAEGLSRFFIRDPAGNRIEIGQR